MKEVKDAKQSINMHQNNDKQNKIKEDYKDNNIIPNKKLCANINNEFKDRVKTNSIIKNDEVNIVKIIPDGNCFYRAVSFFLLGSQEYYIDIKKMIIWK